MFQGNQITPVHRTSAPHVRIVTHTQQVVGKFMDLSGKASWMRKILIPNSTYIGRHSEIIEYTTYQQGIINKRVTTASGYKITKLLCTVSYEELHQIQFLIRE